MQHCIALLRRFIFVFVLTNPIVLKNTLVTDVIFKGSAGLIGSTFHD